MAEDPATSRLTTLIDRYCAVWGEPDPARRAALLAEVWGPGATYTDPRVHATSAAELLVHIDKVLGHCRGAKVVRTSALDVHHGMARFAWHVVLADGSTLPEGIDIAEFTADAQRIQRIVGFFGPLRPVG